MLKWTDVLSKNIFCNLNQLFAVETGLHLDSVCLRAHEKSNFKSLFKPSTHYYWSMLRYKCSPKNIIFSCIYYDKFWTNISIQLIIFLFLTLTEHTCFMFTGL